jgi:hypothetical protein
VCIVLQAVDNHLEIVLPMFVRSVLTLNNELHFTSLNMWQICPHCPCDGGFLDHDHPSRLCHSACVSMRHACAESHFASVQSPPMGAMHALQHAVKRKYSNPIATGHKINLKHSSTARVNFCQQLVVPCARQSPASLNVGRSVLPQG